MDEGAFNVTIWNYYLKIISTGLSDEYVSNLNPVDLSLYSTLSYYTSSNAVGISKKIPLVPKFGIASKEAYTC